MKKNKLLVSSLLATLMSISLIGGATYSLFTSESTHNITVSAATVDVQSQIKDNSLSVFSLNGYTHATDFANGGKAILEQTKKKDIEITKITAGDGVKFNIEIQNKSTSKVKYRVTFKITESSFKEEEFTFEGPATDWTPLEANQKDPIDAGQYTLTLKESATTQEASAKISIIVEAHQFNDPALKETTITFDSQGGSAVSSITKINGRDVTAPTDPTRDNYEFGGWYKNTECTEDNKFTFNKMPAEDIKLYAKWTPIKYKVTYNLNEGAFDVETPSVDIAYGSKMDLKTPTREGYTFDGWYTDLTFVDGTSKITVESTMPSNDIDVYAKWTANQYAVTFNLNNGSLPAGTATPYNKEYGTAIGELPKPTRDGFTFIGWFTNIELSVAYDSSTTMPLNGYTVYAKWEANGPESSTEKTITLKMKGRDERITAEPGSPIDLYTSGDTGIVKASDFPEGKPNFLGWSTDIDGNQRYDTITMPSTDMTLYPKFDIERFIYNEWSESSIAGLKAEYAESGGDLALKEQIKNICEFPAIRKSINDNLIAMTKISDNENIYDGAASYTKEFYIPSTYTEIVGYLFAKGLGKQFEYEKIHLSENLEILPEGIADSEKLTSLTLPAKTKTIKEDAIDTNCNALKSIYIPKNIIDEIEGSISNSAFPAYDNTTTVYLEDIKEQDSWKAKPFFENVKFEEWKK